MWENYNNEIDRKILRYRFRFSLSGAGCADLTTEKLMEQISKVFQDVLSFDDTLEANVLIGRPDDSGGIRTRVAELAGVSEIVAACQMAGKRAVARGDVPFREEPEGIHCPALLKRSTDCLVRQGRLRLSMPNKSTANEINERTEQRFNLLVIAHKLETIQAADKIVVLAENGTVAQIGNHQSWCKILVLIMDFGCNGIKMRVGN